jgi:hypothetical protein
MHATLAKSLVVAILLLNAMNALATTCYRTKGGPPGFLRREPVFTLVLSGRLDEMDQLIYSRGGTPDVKSDMQCSPTAPVRCTLASESGTVSVLYQENIAKIVVRGELSLRRDDGGGSLISVAAGSSQRVYDFEQLSETECKRVVPEPVKVVVFPRRARPVETFVPAVVEVAR